MSETPGIRPLRFGEALPHAHVPSNRNPRFALSSIGGRFFLAGAALDLSNPATKSALTLLAATPVEEANRFAALFCGDPSFESVAIVAAVGQSKAVVADPTRTLIRALGLVDEAREPLGRWVLFDPSLRVLGLWPLHQAANALAALAAAPEPGAHAGVPLHAPVLIAPRIFEPASASSSSPIMAIGGQLSGATREAKPMWR